MENSGWHQACPAGGTVSVRAIQLHDAPEVKGLQEIRVKDNGTGLGVAISKNIIDVMGGTIEVTRQIRAPGDDTPIVIRTAKEWRRLRLHSFFPLPSLSTDSSQRSGTWGVDDLRSAAYTCTNWIKIFRAGCDSPPVVKPTSRKA